MPVSSRVAEELSDLVVRAQAALPEGVATQRPAGEARSLNAEGDDPVQWTEWVEWVQWIQWIEWTAR